MRRWPMEAVHKIHAMDAMDFMDDQGAWIPYYPQERTCLCSDREYGFAHF
jgi:hypothetical protein